MTITFRQRFWKLEVNLGFIWSHKYSILIINYLLNNLWSSCLTEAWAHALVPQWVLPHWGLVWHNLKRLGKFLQWLFLDMLFLQNHSNVGQNMLPWRHNRDVKMNIMIQNHIYFVWATSQCTKPSTIVDIHQPALIPCPVSYHPSPQHYTHIM